MKRPLGVRAVLRQGAGDFPLWVGRAERLLSEAIRSTRVLGAVTPRNAAQERERLVQAFESGAGAEPRWSYARTDHSALRRALDRAASRLAEERHPVAHLYAARARELELEAALASEAGRPALGALARTRFGPVSCELAAKASVLAREWMTLPPAPPGPEPERMTTSDGQDPSSLFSKMSAAVGRLRLPFAVMVQPQLAALAATGERHVLIAAGRRLTEEDVERTVLHEIEAHVIPRGRASKLALGIFQIGTARGSDDQEGLALVLEERHGFLGPRRRRELAARHVVADAMLDGASFVDGVRLLAGTHGLAPRDAIAVAERVYRGGDGVSAGLGRERVYLESFLRVRARLQERPTDEAVLASGQIAVDAIARLASFAQKPK